MFQIGPGDETTMPNRKGEYVKLPLVLTRITTDDIIPRISFAHHPPNSYAMVSVSNLFIVVHLQGHTAACVGGAPETLCLSGKVCSEVSFDVIEGFVAGISTERVLVEGNVDIGVEETPKLGEKLGDFVSECFRDNFFYDGEEQ